MKKVKNKLVAKDAAFRSGDDEEFRRAKYDARRAIARAKADWRVWSTTLMSRPTGVKLRGWLAGALRMTWS